MEQRQTHPPAWKPDSGDTISGFVVDRLTVDGNYGPVEILVIDNGETSQSVWCSCSALKTLLKDLNPPPGSFLTIRYLGEEMTTRGFFRKVYEWGEE